MSKDKYIKLCQNQPDIPLFSQPWWLNAVAGDSWDVVIIEKGGEVHASLPFLTKSKFGMTVLTQPKLTQSLGPWIRNTDAKYSGVIAREKELMSALIELLPRYDFFEQSFDHSITNWMPFFWSGFQQTTRYTYRINDLSDLDAIWSGFQENIRREIKKASKKKNITVTHNGDFEDFLTLNNKTFGRQGLSNPYDRGFLENVESAASERNQRQIFIASDETGRQHAAVYIVWDNRSAYYLMGGADPELRNSGAVSLCMWEAIQFAATVTNSFDFEGSMIEPIERFFRGFGAHQTAYHRVSRAPSKVIRMAIALKGIMQQ